ncbi:hypothetical protein HGRIS_005436 [Hohenbuehelia grisea]|uniref:Chromo domain-containing protein n=1 Tax=Hohenbuehelia grisea TaxID=104357 RepID=A0ABR3JWU0_9AGAR
MAYSPIQLVLSQLELSTRMLPNWRWGTTVAFRDEHESLHIQDMPHGAVPPIQGQTLASLRSLLQPSQNGPFQARNTAKAEGDSDDEHDSASQLDPDEEVEQYEKAVEEAIEAIAKGAEDEMVLEEGEPIVVQDIPMDVSLDESRDNPKNDGTEAVEVEVLDLDLEVLDELTEDVIASVAEQLKGMSLTAAPQQMMRIAESVQHLTSRLVRMAIETDPSAVSFAPSRKPPGRRPSMNSISDDEGSEGEEEEEDKDSSEGPESSDEEESEPERKRLKRSCAALSGREREYEIEKILQAGFDDDGKQIFLVKWKGYRSAENSWILEENAGNAKDIIRNFWESEVKRKADVGKPPSAHNDKDPSKSNAPIEDHIGLRFQDLAYHRRLKLLICRKCPTGLPYVGVYNHLTKASHSVPHISGSKKVPSICPTEKVLHGLKMKKSDFYQALKAVLAEHGIDDREVLDTTNDNVLWHNNFRNLYTSFPQTVPQIDGLKVYPAVRCEPCGQCFVGMNIFRLHVVETPSGRLCSASAKRAAAAAAAADISASASSSGKRKRGAKEPDPPGVAGGSKGKGKAKEKDEQGRPAQSLRNLGVKNSLPLHAPALAQTISRTPSLQYYFAVDGDWSAAGKIPGKAPPTWKEKWQANKDRLREQALKAHEGVKKDMFVQTEGIGKFLEVFDPAEVYKACHTPQKGFHSSNALRRRLASLREEGPVSDTRIVQSFHPSVRFLLKDCSPRTRPGSDWKANIGRASLLIYCALQEMLICALAKHLAKPVRSRDGKSTLFRLTAVQARAIRELLVSLFIDRSEPLNEDERRFAVDRMYNMLYTIYFPPPKARILSDLFSSPLIAFLAAQWIRKDGTYLEIHEFTPFLAKMQFMMRLAGFHNIHESFQAIKEEQDSLSANSSHPGGSDSPDDSPDLDSPVDADFLLKQMMEDQRPTRRTLEDHKRELEEEQKTGTKRWFNLAQTWTKLNLQEFMPTPFAVLRSWMHLGTHIANRTTRRPVIVTTEEAGGTIQLGTSFFTLAQYFAAIRREIELLIQLIRIILMGINLVKLGIQYDPHSIQDTMDETTPSYGVFQALDNEDSDKLMDAFRKIRAFFQDENPEKIDPKKVVEWLSRVAEAWKILYTLQHMLSGPVARGTEEAYFNIVNQTGGRRHVFFTKVNNGPLLLQQSDYHKNMKQKSVAKEIHQVSPHILSEVTWILVHLIRPIEANLALDHLVSRDEFENAAKEYSTGLYVSLGCRMDTLAMSNCLKMFFEKNFECSIGLRLFRHISIFIQRRELSKAPRDDRAKKLVVAAEVMNGHTPETGENIYARLFEMGTSSTSLKDMQISICLMLHRVYGVDSFPPSSNGEGPIGPVLTYESSDGTAGPSKPKFAKRAASRQTKMKSSKARRA